MKIDCNITQNYMNEQQRMCEFYKDCHEGCPAYYICNSVQRRELDMIPIVQTWSDLNPQRTFLSDFLEKYPNAAIDSDGIPYEICPHTLGLSEFDECNGDESICSSCWNQPIQ